MDNLGIIQGCAQANCGYKCCSFGSKGHIVILPHEFDGHENEISHLEILTEIAFKQLTLNDYDEVETLENEIGKDPRMCMKSDSEDIKKCLHSGCSKAVIENGSIVAYTLAYFTDYGTAYIEKVYVSESWRGRGLQCELVKEAMKSLLSHDVHETYTMASPYNQASLHNFQKVGFRILRETRCNGYDRMILRRTL